VVFVDLRRRVESLGDEFVQVRRQGAGCGLLLQAHGVPDITLDLRLIRNVQDHAVLEHLDVEPGRFTATADRVLELVELRLDRTGPRRGIVP